MVLNDASISCFHHFYLSDKFSLYFLKPVPNQSLPSKPSSKRVGSFVALSLLASSGTGYLAHSEALSEVLVLTQ